MCSYQVQRWRGCKKGLDYNEYIIRWIGEGCLQFKPIKEAPLITLKSRVLSARANGQSCNGRRKPRRPKLEDLLETDILVSRQVHISGTSTKPLRPIMHSAVHGNIVKDIRH